MEPKQRPLGAKEYADKIRARIKSNAEKAAAPVDDEQQKIVVLDDGNFETFISRSLDLHLT